MRVVELLAAVVTAGCAAALLWRWGVARAWSGLVGLLVLVLGIGWQWLRRLVVSCLPASLIRRLPPVAAATG